MLSKHARKSHSVITTSRRCSGICWTGESERHTHTYSKPWWIRSYTSLFQCVLTLPLPSAISRHTWQFPVPDIFKKPEELSFKDYPLIPVTTSSYGVIMPTPSISLWRGTSFKELLRHVISIDFDFERQPSEATSSPNGHQREIWWPMDQRNRYLETPKAL